MESPDNTSADDQEGLFEVKLRTEGLVKAGCYWFLRTNNPLRPLPLPILVARSGPDPSDDDGFLLHPDRHPEVAKRWSVLKSEGERVTSGRTHPTAQGD